MHHSFERIIGDKSRIALLLKLQLSSRITHIRLQAIDDITQLDLLLLDKLVAVSLLLELFFQLSLRISGAKHQIFLAIAALIRIRFGGYWEIVRRI